MTLTLELPPEVEGALVDEARHKGKTPKQIVLEDLRRRYSVAAPWADSMAALQANRGRAIALGTENKGR